MVQAMQTASSWRSTLRCSSWLQPLWARRQTFQLLALQMTGKYRYLLSQGSQGIYLDSTEPLRNLG